MVAGANNGGGSRITLLGREGGDQRSHVSNASTKALEHVSGAAGE